MSGAQNATGGGSSSSPRPSLIAMAIATAWWALVVYPEIVVAVVAKAVAG